MMVDVRGCICANCGQKRPWKIVDSIEAEPIEGEKRLIKGPFIEVIPCACPRTDSQALDMNSGFFDDDTR